MRILIINKFLHYVGGSKTYIFKIGEWLEKNKYKVQYFGMEHEGCQVGNRVYAYTSNMDFHSTSKLSLASNANVDDLREKLQRILNHEDVVESNKKEATNFIYQKYNLHEVVEKTLELYSLK